MDARPSAIAASLPSYATKLATKGRKHSAQIAIPLKRQPQQAVCLWFRAGRRTQPVVHNGASKAIFRGAVVDGAGHADGSGAGYQYQSDQGNGKGQFHGTSLMNKDNVRWAARRIARQT